jgi:hypothetical protein
MGAPADVGVLAGAVLTPVMAGWLRSTCQETDRCRVIWVTDSPPQVPHATDSGANAEPGKESATLT